MQIKLNLYYNEIIFFIIHINMKLFNLIYNHYKKNCIILLHLYKSGLLCFNDGILNIPGIRYINKGIIKDTPKLDITSVRR